MSQSRFNKSLVILLDIFKLRESYKPDIYKLASNKLESFLKKGQYQEVYSPDLTVLNMGKIRIIFNLNEKWDSQKLSMRNNDIIEKDMDEYDHLILILSKSNTKEAYKNSKLVQFIKTNLKKTVDLFHINDLQFNVTNHVLVPKHELVTDEKEKDKIQSTYNVSNLTLFPVILSNDPVVKMIGGTSGDLVKVTRTSENAGTHVLYRYCV
jgi:DNA-directed RNA polymerase subunit H (RpoH/RPB5)